MCVDEREENIILQKNALNVVEKKKPYHFDPGGLLRTKGFDDPVV